MKAHIFLIIILKFHLQILCSFWDTAENVTITGIPISNFLCIYITASSPVSHTYFCPRRENKKQPWGKFVQNVSGGQGQLVAESEKTHVKMGTSPLTFGCNFQWYNKYPSSLITIIIYSMIKGRIFRYQGGGEEVTGANSRAKNLILRGYWHLTLKAPKLACFVLYLKIINIFLKNNICIL